MPASITRLERRRAALNGERPVRRSRPVDRPLARYAAAACVAALLMLAILVGMVWAVQAPGRFEGLIRRAIEVTITSPETAPPETAPSPDR